MNDPHDNAQTDKEILARLTKELTPGLRDELVGLGITAFWDAVQDRAQLDSGDFPLHGQLRLEDAMGQAIQRWWELNHA